MSLAEETSRIQKLLPPTPPIQRLNNLILQKVTDIKGKFTLKVDQYNSLFEEGVCPTSKEIEEMVVVRNNAVEELKKTYDSTQRIADAIGGISDFLTLVLTIVKTSQTAIDALALAQLVIPIIPAPVLSKINAATEIAQGIIDKVRFKSDGDPKLVPIVNAIISVNISIQLLVIALENLLKKLETLDSSITDCAQQQQEDKLIEAQNQVEIASEELTQAQSGFDSNGNPIGADGLEIARTNLQNALSDLAKIQSGEDIALLPVDPTIVSFVEANLEENQESVIETTYRGFVFELEKVPFSPTVDRTRANALNKDGIIMIQSELSFTKDPSVLIEELKFIIDRDNLRAE